MDEVRPKILIVDDEPANLELIQRALRRQYDVMTAGSGSEALELLHRERFAAILSDAHMPGMSGTEFLAQARRLVPETVRMILTGYSPEPEQVEAINLAQVSSFLTKPISPAAVARAIGDAVEVFQLSQRHQGLLAELEAKNRDLAEAKRQLELSLDERNRELLEANRRLESMSMRDPLTGLYNHRYFQERLWEELSRRQRYGGTLSLVVADVDRFRCYNEAHGHDAGDRLLVHLAALLVGACPPMTEESSGRLRATDVIARYGGDELALVLCGTSAAGAIALCERLRAAIATTPFAGAEAFPDGRLTLSFGVVEATTDDVTKAQFIEAAELALCRAKQRGRDRLELQRMEADRPH